MKFKFHHMNICTDNLPRLTKFYKTLFELGTIADDEHTVVSGNREDRAYTGKVDFLTAICQSNGTRPFLFSNR
jgi:predicted enzyme related to lactoylglutathione lyase